MKRFIHLALLLTALLSAHSFAAPPPPSVQSDIVTKGPWLDVRAHSSLSAAVAAIGSAKKTLLIPVDQTTTADLVVPANIELLPINGAIINHGTYAFTYSGSTTRWPVAQVLSGSGTVSLGSAANAIRYDEWVGANKDNTAIGHGALASNTTGSVNIAIGKGALASNTIENYSVAIGVDALKSYTGVPGSENTAIGSVALKRLTTGNNNTSVGSDSLTFTTTGNLNTAIGQFAGYSNTTGSNNSFLGDAAGKDNTTGSYNVFVGYRSGALDYPTTGSYNTFVGTDASPYAVGSSPGSPATLLHHVTAIGYYAKPKVSNSLILGGSVADSQAVSVGIGTGEPKTSLEIFGRQDPIHSTPKTVRGLLAIYDSFGSDLPNGNPAVPQANSGAGITLGGFINATELSSWGAIKANKVNATVNDGSGYFDIYTADSTGAMQAKVRVHSNGDVELKTTGAGLIVTSPDGQTTKRVYLNNTGDGFVFATP